MIVVGEEIPFGDDFPYEEFFGDDFPYEEFFGGDGSEFGGSFGNDEETPFTDEPEGKYW
jgi:hypothetical protein